MSKQNAGLGLALALTAAIFWGMLPIAMKQIVHVMPPLTIVWYRFFVASIGLGGFLLVRRQYPAFHRLVSRRIILLFAIATIGLGGNFLLFSSSLLYLSPTAAQIIAQLSPVGMMIAGVFILKEKMQALQWVGGGLILTGLMLFFNRHLSEIFTHLSGYTIGILLGVGAATVWVSYGIVQKILLRQFTSQQILFLLYVSCTLFLFPTATLSSIYQLNVWQLLCLFFCCANTLIAYGAFAEAMAQWQVTRVSAIVTLAPLFSLLFSDILAVLWPNVFTLPELNSVGYIGAIVVVVGAMCATVGNKIFSLRGRK